MYDLCLETSDLCNDNKDMYMHFFPKTEVFEILELFIKKNVRVASRLEQIICIEDKHICISYN